MEQLPKTISIVPQMTVARIGLSIYHGSRKVTQNYFILLWESKISNNLDLHTSKNYMVLKLF